MSKIPLSLLDLYKAAEVVAKQFDRTIESVFDPCGLILNSPPLQGYYWCTPKNAITFASTGGDGVHYSYLDVPDCNLGCGPIVMTMPANDQLNFVVAETLEEFLGLGFHVGWFALEQIAYEPDWAISYFSGSHEEAKTYQQDRLLPLRNELNFKYIALDLARIDALTCKYAQYLRVPLEPQ
ncbi:MAG: hypothetical protein K2Y28_14330 [Burkholderiaceae bacterium]|nr:hypothetical protein [Burkholderiaceae bacterium]